MSLQSFRLALVIISVLLVILTFPDGLSGNKLRKMIEKRSADKKLAVSVPESQAKAFLNSLKRSKRYIWDRSRDDVQQWYQQFVNMGYSEAQFEDAAAYWLGVHQGTGDDDHVRYYIHQRYDGNSPAGPYYSQSIRIGADVNYDDY
ncbi:augurin-like isoform X1 [Stegostoma tigrinum]|uniref:augurin-like isoform X1 n=1 Tax=Stegostoma tigrinum TaxID=3053191 RepID=UPI00202B2548|nr:augurin-like isoform X1 [Stegostoma tigrinum]XP_048388969.1 augurin-like isoform X1 [Stegostoma tigrinum]XP_048388970.1 augurin-like isoform X1 [Stegostoma tigrinum]